VVDREDRARVGVRRSGRLLRDEVDAEAAEVPARGLAVDFDEEAARRAPRDDLDDAELSPAARPAERREGAPRSLP
jgi:hypothetical protein